ncbi:MAG TPA: redoxin domain-containing protein [Actinomycetota bacterium]|nr:redoxin domain-containing protein [Actinomycetota bacterium]
MSQLGQAAPRVEAIGGSIAAVAVTATFSQMAFATHLDVSFPLLSDWGRETCGAYGVRYDVWKEHDGLAMRSLFVIDREGAIRYRWMTEDALVTPDEREAIDVMASL